MPLLSELLIESFDVSSNPGLTHGEMQFQGLKSEKISK